MRTVHRVRTMLVVTVIAASAASLAAHTGTGASAPATVTSSASFDEVDCPADVRSGVSNAISCGYLTVPEDHAAPDGDTVRVFVTRIQPDGEPRAADPMFIPTVNLAWMPHYPGIAPLANRVGRDVIIMDQRGVGHSEPRLACDEVEAAKSGPGGPLGVSPFLTAVEACRDRLVSSGIDLAAYDLAQTAADAEALRIALGIDRWNLQTMSSSSVIALEILRRYPDGVRALVLADADLPQVDWFTEAALSTRYGFDQVVAACREQVACDEAFPNLGVDWQSGLEALEASPVLAKSAGMEFEVDGTAFLRYLRHGLTTHYLSFYPIAMTRLDLDDFTELTSKPMFSVGYMDEPDIPPWFSHGVFYSVLCRDELPFVDHEALADAAGNETSYVEAFVNNPYFDACERWNVAPAPDDPHVLVQTDVPALFLAGRFNPFSSLELVNEGASRFTNSQVVVFPTLASDVMDTDCGPAVRNSWIDALTTPDTSCIDQLPPIEFVVEP